MSTKTEVVAAINAALTVANSLDDQAATIAQLTQQRDDAVGLAAQRLATINAIKGKILEANQADADEEAADSAGDTARAQALALANSAP